jgi:nitrate reductase gamma subunit
MLRWRNLVVLFIVDDVLLVLSAVTQKNKNDAGTASDIIYVIFLIGVAALIAGLIAMWVRSSRSKQTDG